MSAQMVNIDHRYPQRTGESLGKGDAYEQRPHQSRPACEGHGAQLFLRHSGTLQRLVDHGDDVLLMGTRSQFGDNTSVGLMNSLAGDNVRQQVTISDHGSRCIVARRFYS